MRVVHAAALTAAALVLASVASAQGLGDAAARERDKRKADPAKPAKVYTEGDIGRSMAPVVPQELPATAEAGARRPRSRGSPRPRDSPPPGETRRPKARPRPRARLLPPRAPRLPAAKAAADAREGRRGGAGEGQARLEQAPRAGPQGRGRLQGRHRHAAGGAQRHRRRLYNPNRAAKIAFQEENKSPARPDAGDDRDPRGRRPRNRVQESPLRPAPAGGLTLTRSARPDARRARPSTR